MHRTISSYDARHVAEDDLVRQLVEAADVSEIIDRIEMNTRPRASSTIRSVLPLDAPVISPSASLDTRPSLVSPAPAEFQRDSGGFVRFRSSDREPQSRSRRRRAHIRHVRNSPADADDALTATTEEAPTQQNEVVEFDFFEEEDDDDDDVAVYGAAPPRIIEREQHLRPRAVNAVPPCDVPAAPPPPPPPPQQQQQHINEEEKDFGEIARSRTRAHAAEAKSVRLDMATSNSHLMSPAFSPLRSEFPLLNAEVLLEKNGKGGARNGSERTSEACMPLSPIKDGSDSRDKPATPLQKGANERESQPPRKDHDEPKKEKQQTAPHGDSPTPAAPPVRDKRKSPPVRGRRSGSASYVSSVSSASSSSSSRAARSSGDSLRAPRPQSPSRGLAKAKVNANAMVHPPMRCGRRQTMPPQALRRRAEKCPPPPLASYGAFGDSCTSAVSQRTEGALKGSPRGSNGHSYYDKYRGNRSNEGNEYEVEGGQSFASALMRGTWRRGTPTSGMGPYMSFLDKSKPVLGGAPAHTNYPQTQRHHVSSTPPMLHSQESQGSVKRYPVYRSTSESHGHVVFHRSTVPVSYSLRSNSETLTRRSGSTRAAASLARVGQRGKLQELVWQSSYSGAVAGRRSRESSAHSAQRHPHLTSTEQHWQLKQAQQQQQPNVISQRARSASNAHAASEEQTTEPTYRRFANSQRSLSAAAVTRQESLAGTSFSETPQIHSASMTSDSETQTFRIDLPYKTRRDNRRPVPTMHPSTYY